MLSFIRIDFLNGFISKHGELIANNPLFKKKTNVCFVKKIDNSNIKVKVFDYKNCYENFSLLALAAAVAVGKGLQILDNNVNVHTEYGNINVTVDKKENVTINGKSNLVFIGNIGDDLNA